MNLISVNQISRQAGARTLFQDISFGINEGDKVAIIGVNGCGKSTLLKLLAGTEEPDSGSIARNKSLKIAWLPQTVSFEPGHSIRDHIFHSDSPKLRLVRDYEETLMAAASGNPQAAEKLELLEQEIEKSGAWQMESDIRSILSHLSIKNMQLPMSQLSGGMLKKVALAQMLIEESNLLLLDEPTNHLDPETIAWLEEFLALTDKAVILITHDRYFLDNVINQILEIDEQRIYRFEGNYSVYLEKKAQVEAVRQRTEHRRQRLLSTELEWLRRQPKARTTRQKARQDRAEALVSFRKTEKPKMEALYTEFRRQGKKILELKNISKNFDGRQVVPPFSYEFMAGERIGIIGPNGSGKSSFLNLVAGHLESDSGNIVRGVNTVIGYFDQQSESLNQELTVLKSVQAIAYQLELAGGKKVSAADFLEYFLFAPASHQLQVKKLSGGEKRRLLLIQILMQNPNFLILDEPTNDFDLQTLAVLEDFLLSFTGCVIIVSHDRYFLDRLCNYLFVFNPGRSILPYIGTCSEYLSEKLLEEKEDKKEARAEKNESKNAQRSRPKTKLSYQEQREYDQLGQEIEKLENRLASLHSDLSSGLTDSQKISQLAAEHEEKELLLLQYLERREELLASLTG